MTTFYLIRHGECDGLGNVLWGRLPNVHLNAEGKRSAQRVAQKLAAYKLDMIYSSPLERAIETAKEIASGRNVPLQINDTFNELDFGDWTGESITELATEPVWRQYNAARSRTAIPGGESVFAAQERVVGELHRLSEQHRDRRFAIVSHAEPIRLALSYFRGTPIDEWYRMEVAPCSINVLLLNESLV
jgi:broad specificity phosphatase PhoE